MRFSSSLPVAALIACTSTAAQSQTPVETVIVSARVPDPVGNGAFSVARLDAEALHAMPQLDEALKQVPGLSLFRRNSSLSANPTTQGVSLRSIAPSGAGRSLVTLDGVPQNDPFGGWVIWSALPGEAIRSAEVVRGAGAGPYGAGALTGVVGLAEGEGSTLLANASWGELQTGRAAAAGGGRAGPLPFFASASAQTSGGWIPVDPAQRGAADDRVTLDAYNASLRLNASVAAGTTLAARAAYYDERRNSGLVGSASKARGTAASLTLAHPEGGGHSGWRLQAWLRDTDFANSSVAVAPARAFTTPSNNQYATPATGWGFNAALRDSWSAFHWEIGADARWAEGESRELFSFVSGAFTQRRIAGGRNIVGGAYAEGAGQFGDWLLTLGARADKWSSSGGHLIQSSVATGAVSLNDHPASRSGVVPTARAGLRRDFGNVHLRSAAYAGFRAPSLNELYRPFRLGNNVTQANAALEPERLYGAELGAGGDTGPLSWSITGFFNRLHGAITNVTVAAGPGNFPGVGFIPTGGLLIQRRNAGDIDANGIEAEAQWQPHSGVRLNAAFDLVDAHVKGGAQAPQLTGKRPAQAPRWTITGGATVRPIDSLVVFVGARYESVRFADDQNTLKLGSALSFDARADWTFAPHWSAYVAAANLFDAKIATTRGADGIVSYDSPRLIRAGLAFLL